MAIPPDYTANPKGAAVGFGSASALKKTNKFATTLPHRVKAAGASDPGRFSLGSQDRGRFALGQQPAPAPAPALPPALAFHDYTPPAIQLPKWNQPVYEAAPGALSAPEIAMFDQRQRTAKRGWQEARNRFQVGRQAADGSFRGSRRDIGQQAVRNEMGARQNASSRNLAFAPMVLGKDLVAVRDQRQAGLNNAATARAQAVAELQSLVNSAKDSYESELGAIAAEKAARQAELNRLVRGTGV